MCRDGCTCGRHRRLPLSASVVDRLWRQTTVLDSGCLRWDGAKTNDGYGLIGWNGKLWFVHRVAYQIFCGEIDADKEIDHVSARGCVSRACWNHEHLEVVTHRENCLRGDTLGAIHAAKTHCPQGHPYSEPNLYIEPKSGGRRCRKCDYAKNRRRRERIKASRA